MKLTQEMLLRYADGHLDARTREQIEHLLQTNSDAAEKLRLIQLSGAALANEAARAEEASGTGILGHRIPGRDPDPQRSGTDMTSPASRPDRNSVWPLGSWGALQITASFVLLTIGLAAGYFIQNTAGPNKGEYLASHPTWLVRVVDYHTLYDRETVSPSHAGPDEIVALEQRFAAALGHPIKIPDLGAEQLEFRRGQILKFDSRPIIQLAYLPKNTGRPVALCLKHTAKGNTDPAYEKLHNLGLVRWRQDNIEYVLVGDHAEAKLRAGVADAMKQIKNAKRI